MSSLVDPSTPSQGRELLDDPAAPGTLSVSSVTLQGSQAIAELRQALADDDIQRRWAFFRLTDGRWLLAQPDPDAFGEPQVNESPHFRLHYRAQDEPLARDLINLAEGSYVTLCGEFRCRNSNRLLTLNLLYDGDQVPAAQPGSVDLPSPWLAGVTEDGEPHRAWEQLLVRQLARSLALSRLPTASPGLVDALGDWATVSVAGVPDESRELLRAAIQTGELPPLARAWDEVVLPGRHGDPLTAAQVQSMLTFLEDSAGEHGIGDLLDAMARSPDRLDLADLLRRGVGTDLAPFEAAWMRWLEEDTSAGASSAETG